MTLLLGFGAVNTGNNLLYLMVSALLGFMSVSGFLGHWNLQKLDLTLEPPEEIYAGLETLVNVKVFNRRRWLPAFLLDISIDNNYRHPGHLALLKRREQQGVGVAMTFPDRGDHCQHRVTVSSAFPINFFVRYRHVELQQAITVFPRPIHCYNQGVTDVQHESGGENALRRGFDGDIHQIKDYVGGEPLKMIHWKLSARHDSLKLKELSSQYQPPIEIDPLALPGQELEQQLCCASYLVNDLICSHQPVGLKLKSHVIAPGLGNAHKIYLLKELARYGKD
ncbi:Uncharacterized conserved protein, DUF58 family, contains vWF domain [Desulfuromusa kysingii]|uniref:Uncharacterized conserved protein, DUF58 family, contains vWF domain n=1 Tax=Desulfuromusa kysingii TaxID=37625 RepID=A0A1H4BMZ1_9BACT|nr:DUF58 domain-containing protein [Desulfuromusa kysingii]SEA49499.1 Uncharacterized conserved protein, DUF58 family, contains vWF domain [Desulfuromusa kysingii]